MKTRCIALAALLFLFFRNYSQSPGCPAITPVGATICQGQCASLTATAATNNQTTSYAVNAIAYAPFPYAGGTGVSVGTDDVWSPVVNLGFNFCFFGNSYNSVVLGSNGVLTFDLTKASQASGYQITNALPSTANSSMPGNSIAVCFRDIDPSRGGNVRYYITGSSPCRALVFYFDNVPLYQSGTCIGSPNSKFQLVLYENTNYIDIYVENSTTCSFNNGRGIIGIQNAAASTAVCPPNRNMGAWTAVNEGWRFSPTGAPSYTVTWRGPGNTVVGSGLGPISVCPTTSTTYTASMVITNCDGATTTYTNIAPVTVNNSPTVTLASTGTLNCSGNTAITAGVTPAGTYNWSGPGVVTGGTTTSPGVNQPGVYTLTATAAGCTSTASINMVTPPPITLSVNSPGICPGGTAMLTASGAATYVWSPGGSTANPLSVSPGAQTSYTVTGTSAAGCVGSAVSTVTINPTPLATLSSTNASCGSSNGVILINNTSGPGQTVTGFASSAGSVSGQTVTGLPAGTHVITVTNNFGCTYTVSATLSNSPPITDVVLTPANIPCGTGTGSIGIGAVTGGTAPYTYAVNGGAFSASPPVTGLAAGTYSITVRDTYGCTFTKTAVISVIPGPTAISGNSSPAGCSMSNGSYNITGVTGGTPAYTFSINGVSTSSLSSGLAAGSYSITVKDANACTFTQVVTVNGTAGPTSAVVGTGNAACGMANGSATVTSVSGGAPAYSYSFDGGAFGGSSAAGLLAGSHSVVIRDANSCTLSVSYNVANNGSPSLSLTASNNVLCNGGTTGSFTVVASGGSGAPFTYTLSSPFQTNGTGQFAGLPAGTYTVNARDNVGCITTTSVNITQPAALNVALTAAPAKCFGAANGTITATGSGGAPGYQYQLNGTGYQASGIFSTVPANTHIIQVRDANGCTATQTVTVNQPTALALNISTQNANCTAANGIASSTVTGGTSPYTYAWTGGGGTNAATGGLVSGTYSLAVTDNNGCVINGSGLIGNTPGGTAAITGSTNITCNGASNGILTANMVSGGTAPYTYSWSPGGQTTSTASNLPPGTYTCTIRDNYGCLATATGTLAEPTPLTVLMSSNNARCFGTNTGTVSAAGSGGTSPYTYNWTTLSSTLATVPNVGAGTYTCQIRDANNCVVNTTISVTQPSSVTLTASITPASCNQSNGSATVTASGGTPAYSYTWSSGSTTNVQNSVPAATYTIQVRDANTCTYTLSATVPNLSGPSVAISSFTNVSCSGGTNGTAIAQGSGGNGTLTYAWSNGQATPAATNLNAAVHTVTVTDQTGCIASTSVTITQPAVLTASVMSANPKCFGATNGSATVTSFGGTPAYTYNWTGGGGTNAGSAPLGAGNYAVNVTDAKGCVVTATVSLVNPPAMTAAITSTNVSCFGACNGLGTGSAANNAGTVSYYWTGGPSPLTTQNVSGLCAGSYTLTATDQNSCTASVQVTISQPAQVTANISTSSSVTCNGGGNGSAQVTPGGGTGAYTYTWTGAAAGSSANANNLPAGTYTVTVGDANNCTASTQVVIQQPAPLTTTLTTTDPKCNGLANGTGNLAFTGGAGLPQIQWAPGMQNGNAVNNLSAGNQSVTITYNGSCATTLTFTLTNPPVLTAVVSATNSNCGQSNGNATATVGGGTGTYTYLWSNGATTLNNNNVLAGAYNFTVTDANSCKAQATAVVNDVAGPVVVVTSTTAVKCFGGSNGAATTSISGGVAPYTIAWNNHPATTQNVSSFNAGSHNITVTDAAGCVGTANVMIGQPSQLVSAISSFSNVTCFGLSNGQASLSASGGTAGYSYSWTPSGQSSAVLANVSAGTYTGVVTDANNCTSTQVVTITQPAALLIAASGFTNISCFGANNGQISTTVQGGTPGYTYSWTPAQANSGVLNGLAPGGYSLTVTDTKTCSATANFTILEPSALASTYTSTPAKCGLANGAATVTASGGTPGYTYNWNAGAQQSAAATGMGPGSGWTCLITDSKGCTRTQTVSVADAPSPVITGITANPTTCPTTQDGSIAVTYSLGTPGYTVAWSAPISPATQVTSGLTQSVSGVGAGNYSVTITDSYGCSVGGFATVSSPNTLQMNVSPAQTICYGQSAQVFASGSGGTPGYTYTWTPAFNSTGGPHTTPTLTTTTQYNVAMSDAKGCTTAPRVILVNVTPPLAITGQTLEVCHGAPALLTPTVTSPGRGAGFITYSWQPGGATTSSLMPVGNIATTPNHYTVSVSDGCTMPGASYVYTVTVNPLPTGTITANTSTLCAPGAVTFSVNSASTNTFAWYKSKLEIGTGQQVTYNAPAADTIRVNVVITNQFGCVSNVSMPGYVLAYGTPTAAFVANPQPTTLVDPVIHFTNTSTGGDNYLWVFGDGKAAFGGNSPVIFSPSHAYDYAGTYTVTLVATSIHGCRDEASGVVEIKPDFALYVPNSFTPDGNGLNDFFMPMGVGINEDNYRMDIYDRWGEQIFTSNNFQKGWDGTVKGNAGIAEEGVYVYKLMVYDMLGNKHLFVGHVTVLRASD